MADYLQEGQVVKVKVLETDDKGRIQLSMKALLDRPEGMEDRPPREFRERGDRPPRAEREERPAPAESAEGADQQQQ